MQSNTENKCSDLICPYVRSDLIQFKLDFDTIDIIKLCKLAAQIGQHYNGG